MAPQIHDFDRIPVIDLSGLRTNDAKAHQAVIDQLKYAASKVGFFYITGHGCPPELRERLLSRAKQLFALPLPEKMDVYIAKRRNHGVTSRPEKRFSLATLPT